MNAAGLALVPSPSQRSTPSTVAWPGPSSRGDFTGADLRFLTASAIDSEVLFAIGARTANEELVAQIGLAHEWKKGARDGVVFFLHRPDGTVSAQWRPNVPPTRTKAEGKAPKYLFAPGMHTPVWLHPMMNTRRTTASSYVLCEGTKQYLAAVSAFAHRDDVIVMGTPGCWGWSKAKEVSPDLLAVIPAGATLTVVFDADLMSNPNVWAAGASLDDQLGQHNITTRFALTPETGAGTDGLDDLLSTIPESDREAWLEALIQNAGPLPAQPKGFLGSGVPVARCAPAVLRKMEPQPWPQVLEEGSGWSIIHRANDAEVLAAVRDEEFTGVVVMKRGEEVWGMHHVADFVPWRRARIQTRRGTTTIGETQWTVEIVTAARTWRATMDDKGSLSPTSVQEATGAAVALPVERVELNALRTTLSMLGAEERRDDVEYASTGWHQIDGRWTMVAPAGSINADGLRDDLVVPTVRGHAHQASIGWAEVPVTGEGHRRGIAALVALSKILPNRLDVGVAMIGTLTAAPLGMERRTSSCIQAPAGTGKSVLLRLASGATSVRPDGSFLVSVPKATALGAVSMLEWSRHLPAFVDDYRRSPDPAASSDNAKAAAVLAQVAQCCYAGDAEAKRSMTGQLRDTADVNTMAIVTAEALSTESAITERMVCCQVMAEDFPTQSDPNDSIRQFREQHLVTGNLNLGFAGYVRWLAQLKDAGHDIAAQASALAENNARLFGHGRAGETAGALGVGWGFLRGYATSVDCADLLPEGTVIRDALATIVAASAQHNVDVNPTDRLLKALRDMIGGGKGHLRVPSTMLHDQAQAERWGWRVRHGDLQGAGEELGVVANNAIVITPAGLKAARRFAELDGLTVEQCKSALACACLPGTTPGERVPVAVCGDRLRGYALALEHFDVAED